MIFGISDTVMYPVSSCRLNPLVILNSGDQGRVFNAIMYTRMYVCRVEVWGGLSSALSADCHSSLMISPSDYITANQDSLLLIPLNAISFQLFFSELNRMYDCF